MGDALGALSTYRGCKVLVTGHTGFKGAWLTLWLRELGATVTGLALAPHTRPSLFTLAHLDETIDDIRCDITDYDALLKCLLRASPDIVFHLAAQPLVRRSYLEARSTFATNVMGTVNVLEAARHSRSVRALVHVSTDKCYESSTSHHARSEDDPLGGDDPYSASKAAAELALAAYSRSFYSSPASPVLTASGRAGNVIGGGDWAEDRIIPDCVRAIAQQRAIAVRNPGSIRPWQHVLEALCGYLALGAHLLAGARALCGPWNFGPDQTNATTVANVVDALVRAWGQGRWEHLQEDATMHEAPSLFLSSEKAHRQLGWRPRWDFAETVRRTAYWYRAHAEGNDARHLCLDDIHAYMYCDDAIWPPCASGSGQPSGTH